MQKQKQIKGYIHNNQTMSTPKSINNISNPENVLINPSKSPYLTSIHTAHSQKQKLNSSKEPSQNQQDRINKFLALKKLKQTQQHIKKIKCRVKILKLKQQSFRAKTIHHENIIKFTQQANKFKSQHKAEIMKVQHEKEVQTIQARAKNIKLRQQLRQKSMQIRSDIIHQKLYQNRKLKQQSIENDKKFKQLKEQQKKQKQQKRNKILQQEKRQKQKLDRYRQARVNYTKHSKTLDVSQLMEMQSFKQKQLQQLIKIQEDVQKQTMQSVEASRVLKVKLQGVIDRRKFKHSGNQSSITMHLPQINRTSALGELGTLQSSTPLD